MKNARYTLGRVFVAFEADNNADDNADDNAEDDAADASPLASSSCPAWSSLVPYRVDTASDVVVVPPRPAPGHTAAQHLPRAYPLAAEYEFDALDALDPRTLEDVVAEDARGRVFSPVASGGNSGGSSNRLIGVGRLQERAGGRLYFVSVHGRGQDVVRLWRLDVGREGGGGEGEIERMTTRGARRQRAALLCDEVRYVASVEGVYVCSAGGMMVAVRSAGGVGWYRVEGERLVGGGLLTAATAARVPLMGRTRDFSWSQFRGGEARGIPDGVVLDDDGVLWEVATATATAVKAGGGGSRVHRVLAHARVNDDGSETAADTITQSPACLGARLCEASPLHPRLNLVAWEAGVVRVDFREREQRSLLCDFGGQQQFVTALGVPSRATGGARLTRVAVSTPSHVHLYDMRKLGAPVVSWEHGMKYGDVTRTASDGGGATTHAPTLWELQACFPDGLQFLEPKNDDDKDDEDDKDDKDDKEYNGVLVTNSFSGTGVVCAWQVAEAAPRIRFEDGELRANECDINENENDNGNEDDVWFSWRPAALERLDALEPPRLLYNDIHPAPAMPALIHRQESEVTMLEMKHKGGILDGAVRRDFGACLADDGATLIRYGTLGEILVGTITNVDRDAVRNGCFPEPHPEVEVEVVPVNSCPPEHARKPRRLTTASATAARTTTTTTAAGSTVPPVSVKPTPDDPLPIHTWLRHQISPTPGDNNDDATTTGDPELRTALLAIIKRLNGASISAYEAWNILQAKNAATNFHNDPTKGTATLDASIRRFLGSNNADADPDITTRLLTHLHHHDLLLPLKTSHHQPPTFPTPSFLALWNTLEDHCDNITSRRLPHPQRIHRTTQRLTALELKPEDDTYNKGHGQNRRQARTRDTRDTLSQNDETTRILDAATSVKA